MPNTEVIAVAAIDVVVREQIDKQFNTIKQKTQNLANSLKSIGSTLSVTITPALAFLAKNMIDLSMAATEMENKFNVLFGKNANAMRRWSMDFSKSLGLNQYAVRNMSAEFAQFFNNMGFDAEQTAIMSKNLARLAYDISSFSNISVADTVMGLRSSLMGEEGGQRLGINVQEAQLKKTGKSMGMPYSSGMDETGKLLLRYNTILRQTASAQGDMAKTLDSPANKVRTLKERFAEFETEVGNKFIPTITKAVDVLKQLLNVMSPNAIAGIIIGLMSFGPVLNMLGSFAQIKETFIGGATARVIGGIGKNTLQKEFVEANLGILKKKQLELVEIHNILKRLLSIGSKRDELKFLPKIEQQNQKMEKEIKYYESRNKTLQRQLELENFILEKKKEQNKVTFFGKDVTDYKMGSGILATKIPVAQLLAVVAAIVAIGSAIMVMNEHWNDTKTAMGKFVEFAKAGWDALNNELKLMFHTAYPLKDFFVALGATIIAAFIGVMGILTGIAKIVNYITKTIALGIARVQDGLQLLHNVKYPWHKEESNNYENLLDMYKADEKNAWNPLKAMSEQVKSSNDEIKKGLETTADTYKSTFQTILDKTKEFVDQMNQVLYGEVGQSMGLTDPFTKLQEKGRKLALIGSEPAKAAALGYNMSNLRVNSVSDTMASTAVQAALKSIEMDTAREKQYMAAVAENTQPIAELAKQIADLNKSKDSIVPPSITDTNVPLNADTKVDGGNVKFNNSRVANMNQINPGRNFPTAQPMPTTIPNTPRANSNKH